jgi:hypothetical protein
MRRNLGATALLLVTTAFFGACEGGPEGGSDVEVAPLASPTLDAKRAAQHLLVQYPRAQIRFSQRSGEILWVDGGGLPLQSSGSIPASGNEALQRVRAFLALHPMLYRINPETELAFAPSQWQPGAARQGLSAGVVTFLFTQTFAQVPVFDAHLLAYFDATGNLMGLESRLAPTTQMNAASDMPDAATLSSVVSALTSENAESAGTGVIDKGAGPRKRLAPMLRRHGWVQARGRYQMAEERVERDGAKVTRTWRDSRSGQILRSRDETANVLTSAPQGWASQKLTESEAPDSLGQLRQIPSTRDQGLLMMGFHLPSLHEPGSFVSISDSGNSENPWSVSQTPLTTSALDWTSEPAYESDLRGATRLSQNLKTTLEWYAAHGQRSWDNSGSSFFAAIRTGSPHPTSLSALGGNGQLLLNDFHTPTGQTLGDALDVVAHEFTHSVIDATAAFAYADEPGALNESLADILGKAVQGFTDPFVGSDAGIHIRDITDPENCTPDCAQPAYYGDFQVIELDRGGVHANSGIMNHALAQVVLQGKDRRAQADALGGLILDALKQVAFAFDSRLEEFAASLTGYCRFREQAGTLSAAQAGICERLEASFVDTELLSLTARRE